MRALHMFGIIIDMFKHEDLQISGFKLIKYA